ncbi:hypothetical protein ACI65C_004292 [Semiaphis heraclei]
MLSGEKSQDESRNQSPYEKFKSDAFSILETILNSIESRFVPNEGLLKDCHWLEPKAFPSIKSLNNFPDDVLTKICELAGVERISICYELKQFACQFESFHPKLSECTTKIVYQHNVQQDLLSVNLSSTPRFGAADHDSVLLPPPFGSVRLGWRPLFEPAVLRLSFLLVQLYVVV